MINASKNSIILGATISMRDLTFTWLLRIQIGAILLDEKGIHEVELKLVLKASTLGFVHEVLKGDQLLNDQHEALVKGNAPEFFLI